MFLLPLCLLGIGMQMNITVNNKKQVVESENLTQLIDELAIETKGIAIALNNKVVPRSDWDSTTLSHDDQIIIVSAVFGG